MPRQSSESKHARRPTSKRSKSPASVPASYRAKSRVPQKYKHETGGLGSLVVEHIIEGVVNSVARRVGEAISDAMMGPRIIKHKTDEKTVASKIPTSDSRVEKTVASKIPTSDSHVEKIVASNTPTSDPCVEKHKANEDCIGTYGSDKGECEFYMNMLTECRKAVTSSILDF